MLSLIHKMIKMIGGDIYVLTSSVNPTRILKNNYKNHVIFKHFN